MSKARRGVVGKASVSAGRRAGLGDGQCVLESWGSKEGWTS